ncbi:1-acyl-sn-glycerol-3-phosphate acyltransferase [Kineosporia sp. J2-2]|uniref:1-acyl-sn-glycerol-3-phosphate acyltransferase n=1 Tax=Kineosporia corallincola TaxID=2835133 RepID=A0ABS5TSK7_9ACTN|nr:1-acyl-sn-glycerol-3-phosphate acyltransferase [Kineosporia corallincola]MBT0773802.1 1-acyl-sn-glycerol-3-phosphate acyltransferase [Kineosporia corallincola]
MLPPYLVRRLLLIPLMLLVSLLAVVTAPATLLLAALAGVVIPGQRSRPLRLTTLVIGYLAAEGVALFVLVYLWVAAGFGTRVREPKHERRHYLCVRALLRWIFWMVNHVLRVRVRVEGPAPEAYRDRPLIVFCRHAGPGDSFLLVHALMDWYDREPRIVLKDTLQWDPAIDIVLNRLPTRFIRSGAPGKATVDPANGPDVETQIGELARRLDHDDALVLFPEGGNYTARRRARAIAKLRRRGLLAEAAKAEAMRYVLPPRPGGVLSVLENAPEADVVWVAHTGTDHLLTVADVWGALPTEMDVKMRWWQVPAGSVPASREERIAWLFEWWRQIDDWITVNRVAEGQQETV